MALTIGSPWVAGVFFAHPIDHSIAHYAYLCVNQTTAAPQ